MEPRERRTQLLEHAARLFGDRGYYNTSVSDIVSSADVARGTFYLYFANKRKLFEELVDSLLLRLTSCIETVEVHEAARSPKEQLVDNLVRVFVLLCEERHMLSILLRGAVGLDREIDDKLQDFYREILEAIENSLTLGQQMNLVRRVNTRIAALAVLGAVKEVLHALLDSEYSLDSEREIRQQATDILEIFSIGVLEDGVSIP
ncbi:MAG: TetR/AcrR family transcriptional regulator [Deltaproteobacteria bacterium]|nr:TetR/AcrR family transcriptional regulator [Deltaproteobacteria bacterium]